MQRILPDSEDTAKLAGTVKSTGESLEIAAKVLALPAEDLPRGSLQPDTVLMLCRPQAIKKEWRVWIGDSQIVTVSLYKEGGRVVYRNEIDDDARAFAQRMALLDPDYALAYVMDVCRTADGLFFLETNCINAAGFYAADVLALAAAVDALGAVGQ